MTFFSTEVHSSTLETNLCVSVRLTQLCMCLCAEARGCHKDGRWGFWSRSWECCLLEFAFLFLMGASSTSHPRRSVFLSSYWSPPILINMGKRPPSLRCGASSFCLTLRRCMSEMEEMIHLAKNYILWARLPSISPLAKMSASQGRLLRRALHLGTV